MIKSDFHVHTSFSTDSDTPAREQIEALINKGITEICITDHHDIGYTAIHLKVQIQILSLVRFVLILLPIMRRFLA